MGTARLQATSAFAAAALAVQAAPSVAQQSPEARPSGPIEEVMVTARRREENLQDLAMSIEAFSSEELESRGIETGRDLQLLVPNLSFGRGSATTNEDDLVMRGMPGVGIYVDGIWQGNRGFMVGNIVEMERVEVLLGPQGTLFGRNTNGGAIQYVTRRPGDEFRGKMTLGLGDYTRRSVSGSVDVPLTETLLSKVTLASSERDGFIHSRVTDQDYGHHSNTAVRGDLLWTPTDKLDVRIVASSEEVETTFERQVRFLEPWPEEGRLGWDQCCWTLLYNIVLQNPDMGPYDFWPGELPDFGLPVAEFTPRSNESGFPGGQLGEWESNGVQPLDAQVFDIEQFSLMTSWDINDRFSLRTLTSYREQIGHNYSDLAVSPLTISYDFRVNKDTWFQQELHLEGSLLDDRLNFLVGVFWAERENYERLYRWRFWEFFELDPDGNPTPKMEMVEFVRAWGLANNNAEFANWRPGNPFAGDEFGKSEGTDQAIFGEFNYDISDRLRATLGVRWSWNDNRSLSYDATEAFRTWLPPTLGGGREGGNPFAGILVGAEEQRSPGGVFTPKVSTSYRFDNGAMVYVSYAEGYTTGEVNYVEVLDDFVTLDPEVVGTYEVGLRSEFFDRQLRFNATYFRSDWKGIRVPIHVSHPNDPERFSNVTYSAGKAQAEGLDFSINYFPTDALRFNVAMGFLDTKYLEVGDPETSSLRYGAPFAFAPDFSASAGVQYNWLLRGNGELTFRTDYGYQSEYQRAAAVQRQTPRPEPGYGLWNARIEYVPPSDNWSVSLFVSNIGNERYVDSGITSPPIGLDMIQIGPPRQIDLNISYSFR